MEQLPIIKPDAATRPTLEALVDRVQQAKAADPAADVSALEAEINRLVYRLYGLTEEEIAIVEGKQQPHSPTS